jgi:lysophospholipase L1-like esterase
MIGMIRPICLAAGLAAAVIAAPAATVPRRAPEAGSRAESDRKLNWSFKPDPGLPNVLILGDSISIGYTLQVRALLAGKANVFRPMSAGGRQPANCSGTTAGVKSIDGWLAGRKWDVIHFNWGLHDLKHVTAAGGNTASSKPDDPVQATVEAYGRNLEELVGKLRATGATLIFATTTPVAPGTPNPMREPDAPARYNAAALKIMQAHGIGVDDLYAFCEPQLAKLQLPHNVHFTQAGSAALAKQAAAAILQALPPAKGAPPRVTDDRSAHR